MKKIFSILKKRSELIIGLVVGTIITSCISYGVSQIQSSSVSYTRDGKTMSVEEAIDDLIVKVNKKNLDIELALSDRLRLKTAIENVTWESSNENIATVNSNGLVIAKSKGTAKITVKNDNMSSSVNVTVKEAYLADVVKVGDYVAYDAGSWTSSAGKPTSQGQFGGYTSGQNKANSVDWCESTSYKTTLKGWRVFKVDKNTKTVTLIHAGQPECYYHACSGRGSASVSNLTDRVNIYLNSDYAESAHMMNKDETYQNILLATGDHYFLATVGNENYHLSAISPGGGLFSGCKNDGLPYGIRPVVVLKPNILTTGKGTDKVGQEAWTLVKP